MAQGRRSPGAMNEADLEKHDTSATGSDAADSTPGSGRRKPRWWHKLLLVGFSFFILVIAELLLHLFGYGPDVDFVVTRLDKGDTRIMGINPEAYRRFHFRPLALRSTRFAPWREFVNPKPHRGFRIFFLGGSSVEGYPHAPNGAAPAFLELTLQSAWPDKRVEVINCGVTAINSFSLREWVLEVLEHEPDLLVIYAGHNEFYGAYGPGSLSNMGTSRRVILFNIALRDLKIACVLEGLISRFRSPPERPHGSLMEQLAKDRLIRFNSPTYTACRDNYRANLEDMIRSAQDANVPVVLCGLVSNERDLVPMFSAHKVGLTDEQKRLWRERFDHGMQALEQSEWERALRGFQAAAETDDTYAELTYRCAQCRENLGAIDEARRLYRRARDWDALRFRASAEFSEVIRNVARNHQVIYVDVPAAFEAASPRGLIGWNLMTDHLHPTVRGYYLLAKAVCESLSRPGQPWPAVELSLIPAYEDAARRLGNDEMSEMISKITVYTLTEGFPYAGTPNATLRDRLEKEILQWQTSLKGPPASGHQAWAADRSSDPLHYHVAAAYLRSGDAREALEYFRRADLQSEPHSPPSARAKLGIARCLLKTAGDKAEKADARAYAQEVRGYINDCLLIHPGRPDDFSKLATELDELTR